VALMRTRAEETTTPAMIERGRRRHQRYRGRSPRRDGRSARHHPPREHHRVALLWLLLYSL
jgi:hypothetical protein